MTFLESNYQLSQNLPSLPKKSMRYLLGFFPLVFLWACNASNSQDSVNNVTPRFRAQAFNEEGLESFFSWSEDRIPLVSAHRGGPYSGFPENAIETFQHVVDHTPAVIECDIAMTKDSVLVMMHDYTLDRTTTGSGEVFDKTWEELQSLNLIDNGGKATSFKIPRLDDVLEWGKGKALFTLDVKRGVPFSMVVQAVEKYKMENFAAVISYSANDAQTIYELNNDLMISVGIGNKEAYEAHKALGIPDENMIAFVGVSEPEPSVYQMLHAKGISTILGVLGNLDKKAEARGDQIYAGFVQNGADVLATDRPLEAAKVIVELWPKESMKYKFIDK